MLNSICVQRIHCSRPHVIQLLRSISPPQTFCWYIDRGWISSNSIKSISCGEVFGSSSHASCIGKTVWEFGFISENIHQMSTVLFWMMIKKSEMWLHGYMLRRNIHIFNDKFVVASFCFCQTAHSFSSQLPFNSHPSMWGSWWHLKHIKPVSDTLGHEYKKRWFWWPLIWNQQHRKREHKMNVYQWH